MRCTPRLVAIGAAIVLLSSITAGPAAARPAEEPAKAITASLSAPAVRVGGTVTVRRAIAPVGFTSTVIVQRQVGSSWSDRASGTPDPATGAYRIEISPGDVGTYVLRVRSGGGSVVSPTVTLTVTPKPTIAAALSQSSIAIGSPLIIAGTVRPASATPTVVLQRLVDGRWLDRGTAKVDAARGTFSLALTPSQLGSYVLRVTSAKGSVVSPVLRLDSFAFINNMVDTGQARPGEKVIALTFDDGPDPTYTQQVLDVLKKYGVKATFAVVGYEVEDRPALVGKELAAGHHVASHSWDHPQLTKLSDASIASQLSRTQAQITAAGGPQTRCVRPPYGSQNARVQGDIADFHSNGTLMWDVDPGDWTRPGTAVLTSRILAGVHPGAIIGLHDGGGPRSQTVAAIDAAIPQILARGYQIRPVC